MQKFPAPSFCRIDTKYPNSFQCSLIIVERRIIQIWHCIWFLLKLTNRAAEVKIINVDVSIEHYMCVINGFAEFMVNLTKNKPNRSRSQEFEDNYLKAFLGDDPTLSLLKLVKKLCIRPSTAVRWMQIMRVGKWFTSGIVRMKH